MKNKNKGVLIITSHYPPNIGGVESHLQALVAGLTKRRRKVIISTYQPLASGNSAPKFERIGDLNIYRLPWMGFNVFHFLAPYPILEFAFLFPGLFLNSFRVMWKHRDEVKVIHCQGLVPTSIGIALNWIYHGKNVISSTHNLYFFKKNSLFAKVSKWVFSKADWVLTPTEFSKQELLKIGVKKTKVGRFCYWIDLKKFRPLNKIWVKKQLQWEKFTIFFVGRLIETKGVGLILKMLYRINPNINIAIAGDGPLIDKVKNASNKFPNLIYLGRVENNKLPFYYSGADLVIVPSLVDEGFGFVVMESIACGTPVVASDKGGLRDAVSPVTGKLVSSNAKNFEKAINFYFNNKSALLTLSRNTRGYAQKNFSEENISNILSYYDE